MRFLSEYSIAELFSFQHLLEAEQPAL